MRAIRWAALLLYGFGLPLLGGVIVASYVTTIADTCLR